MADHRNGQDAKSFLTVEMTLNMILENTTDHPISGWSVVFSSMGPVFVLNKLYSLINTTKQLYIGIYGRR